jgi:hypothetical protein
VLPYPSNSAYRENRIWFQKHQIFTFPILNSIAFKFACVKSVTSIMSSMCRFQNNRFSDLVSNIMSLLILCVQPICFVVSLYLKSIIFRCCAPFGSLWGVLGLSYLFCGLAWPPLGHHLDPFCVYWLPLTVICFLFSSIQMHLGLPLAFLGLPGWSGFILEFILRANLAQVLRLHRKCNLP